MQGRSRSFLGTSVQDGARDPLAPIATLVGVADGLLSHFCARLFTILNSRVRAQRRRLTLINNDVALAHELSSEVRSASECFQRVRVQSSQPRRPDPLEECTSALWARSGLSWSTSLRRSTTSVSNVHRQLSFVPDPGSRVSLRHKS